MIYRLVFLGFLGLLSPIISWGQVAFWQKYIGGRSFDYGRVLLYLPDETLLIAAESNSVEQLGGQNHSAQNDIVIFHYTTQEKIIWQRTLGGTGDEFVKQVVRTQDRGYLVIGTSHSSDGDVGQNLGGSDIWLIKLDEFGQTQWSQVFGGRNDDQGLAILETSTGDILIGGESGSPNTGYARPHQGALDGWLAMLTASGNKIWEKHYGGSDNDRVTGIHQTGENQFLIVGVSDSKDGDIKRPLGKKDAWLFEIDGEGEMRWSKNFGGSEQDDALTSTLTPEGDLVVGGTSFSQDQYVPQHQGEGDCWIFKIQVSGEILWSRTFGGSRPDGFNHISLTADSQYAVCGITRSPSNDGDIELNQGYYDGWILKISRRGERLWSRTIGYDGKESLTQVLELQDGGFLCLGYATQARRARFQLPGHHGGGDIWLANFDDPDRLGVKPFRTPPVLVGQVKDKNNLEALSADIILTENKTLDSLGRAKSEADSGNFVLLLPAYGLLSINILAPGYMFLGQEFLMDTVYGKTSLERSFYLDPIRINNKLILENTYFKSGAWDLLPASFAELERIVAFMDLNPRVSIEISGHTDNTGNKDQKIELSLKRAEAVKSYLVQKGIHPNRLKTVGIGMYRPIASNSTSEGRKRNRRVEMKVITM